MQYEVHPAAAIFPMMTNEEIVDLAADIKANGLKHPIVLGEHEGKEVLVDGRNRLEACKIAGVEPRFEKLNGEDQLAFILSINVRRRHLNSGQQAMAVAMMYPKPEKQGRGRKGSAAEHFPEVGKSYLSMARTVLADSRDEAEKVMAGSVFLDAAYQKVKSKAQAAIEPSPKVVNKQGKQKAEPLPKPTESAEQMKNQIDQGIDPFDSCIMSVRSMITDEWLPKIPKDRWQDLVGELRDEINDIEQDLKVRFCQ